MEYSILLDMAAELGYRLAMCGAETFRVEDSINRVLAAYEIEAEAFAIPNYLIVSIKTEAGESLTRMRRIGYHGNDLDAVEKYNELSRRICKEKPDPKTAVSWIQESNAKQKSYTLSFFLLGNCLGAMGFAILFGGTFRDCVCSGVCGLIVGIVNRFMDKLKANQFFRIIAAAFLMALPAYAMHAVRFADNPDTVIIGALMILVPGLLFTNAMRDIIYGDTNSGLNRIVQVFLIAAAIALGTGAALSIASVTWGIQPAPATIEHPLWLECIAAFVGCAGFVILFNIHGTNFYLSSLGGLLAWAVYSAILRFSSEDILAYFLATVTAAAYSEIMARIRKKPAITYLVISIFPLIPGAGVYYTMGYAVRSDMANFASQGMHTVAIAGAIAVGILLCSTAIRLWSNAAFQKQTVI